VASESLPGAQFVRTFLRFSLLPNLISHIGCFLNQFFTRRGDAAFLANARWDSAEAAVGY
jgi:hypothetical protein